tara:strand:+ start:580 stop:813 length:234 start_codon:yes stop_codon:yes gene_type:complete
MAHEYPEGTLPSAFPYLLYRSERAIDLQCLCEMSASLITYLIIPETAQEEGEGAVSHITRIKRITKKSTERYIIVSR